MLFLLHAHLHCFLTHKLLVLNGRNYLVSGSHPNIVRYYNAWYESDHLYIQTELCERSLEVKVGETQAKGEPELLAIMQQVM